MTDTPLENRSYVLAFDTANEKIAIGIGKLCIEDLSVRCVASATYDARRASNTKLLTCIDSMMKKSRIERSELACVCVGRGPGSFTGVRIAMATAKGISSALGISLVGVSTQDAVAWYSWSEGVRGSLIVLGDAMRKEVYPARYQLGDAGVTRLDTSSVISVVDFAASNERADQVSGDALVKYADLFEEVGVFRPEEEWAPTGLGLLLAFQDVWRTGSADPFDPKKFAPEALLPIYTRLSDAEENERKKLAAEDDRDLRSGVQGAIRAQVAKSVGSMDGEGDAGELSQIKFVPFGAEHLDEAARMDADMFTTDAWSRAQFADDIARKNRVWWAAVKGGSLVGYAGALVIDGDANILNVAVSPEYRRRGIARELLKRIAYDASNLAADTLSLEVRVSNDSAIATYDSLGFERLGVRKRFYSDGEDALIMNMPIARLSSADVAGDRLDVRDVDASDISDGVGSSYVPAHPILLAIESSCDETCASVIDGTGKILSDIVASQIDFHSRFGGVVPEIASRKHIEAICGVCKIALEDAGLANGWQDLDAVSSTYAPGLVGALVVGVAFAKGASWALDVPFVGVNHLEGHLYANKIGLPADEPFEPPAVVSLVSGGNTLLVHMIDWGHYEILGSTIDDAVGEAFDKVAKALGLPYPGGPVISKLAAKGDPSAIEFPRALLHSKDFRFSLSGLKTAVNVYIEKCIREGVDLPVEDICAGFQQAVIDVQVAKAAEALRQTDAPTFCLGGGVAANPSLRRAYEDMCTDLGVRLIMPPLASCGDNAAMIALVALERYKQGKFFGLDADAYAHADLSEPY